MVQPPKLTDVANWQHARSGGFAELFLDEQGFMDAFVKRYGELARITHALVEAFLGRKELERAEVTSPARAVMYEVHWLRGTDKRILNRRCNSKRR